MRRVTYEEVYEEFKKKGVIGAWCSETGECVEIGDVEQEDDEIIVTMYKQDEVYRVVNGERDKWVTQFKLCEAQDGSGEVEKRERFLNEWANNLFKEVEKLHKKQEEMDIEKDQKMRELIFASDSDVDAIERRYAYGSARRKGFEDGIYYAMAVLHRTEQTVSRSQRIASKRIDKMVEDFENVTKQIHGREETSNKKLILSEEILTDLEIRRVLEGCGIKCKNFRGNEYELTWDKGTPANLLEIGDMLSQMGYDVSILELKQKPQ